MAHVPCGDLEGDLEGGTHPVFVNPDWSVEIGHDLEVERVAAGLGASPSCLHLVDTVLPALRAGVQLLTRRAVPVLRRGRDRRSWSLDACDCVYNGAPGPRSPELADTVAHARSATHLVLAHDCDPRLLRPLILAATDAHGGWTQPPPGPADRLVIETDGVQRLWDLGVHPGWVVAGHDRFASTSGPMPALFYAALAYLRPDQRYLGAVTAACADPEFVTWALWSHDWRDSHAPTGRADLLRSGVAPADLREAMDGGYTVDQIRALSCRSDRRLAQSAASLAAWARIGCSPSLDDLSWGIGRVLTDDRLIPTSADLDHLLAILPPGCEVSRTQAGQVLAVSGRVDVARLVLQNGVRTPTAAYEFLDDNGFLGCAALGKSPRSEDTCA